MRHILKNLSYWIFFLFRKWRCSERGWSGASGDQKQFSKSFQIFFLKKFEGPIPMLLRYALKMISALIEIWKRDYGVSKWRSTVSLAYPPAHRDRPLFQFPLKLFRVHFRFSVCLPKVSNNRQRKKKSQAYLSAKYF